MPNSSNQKTKLLCLMEILLEKTDEQNQMSIQELIAELKVYGFNAERKSIYSDIEILRKYGIDIIRTQTKHFRYYVGSRQFEIAELKLLVDAVQSSRFITMKKSGELIKKLTRLTSINNAKQLNRFVFIADTPKTLNESIYYNIDTIHQAVIEKRKISFKYFDYSADKKKVIRRNGASYIQTPISLFWSNDCYYLIAYSDNKNDFVYFRVDRMIEVGILDEVGNYKNKFNPAEYMKKNFGVFNGEIAKAVLAFDKSLVNQVIDKFGKDVIILDDGDRILVHSEVSCNPLFFSWIFQFGGQAEIIEPDWLVDHMKKLVQESYKKYFG